MELDSKLCRLCLGSTLESSTLSIKDEELTTKLDVVFNFEFAENDDLPRRVCLECCSKVTEYHAFHELVRTNQTQLSCLSTKAIYLPSLEDIKTEILLESPETDSEQNMHQELEKDHEEVALEFTECEPRNDECDQLALRSRFVRNTKQTTDSFKPKKESNHNKEKVKKLDEENKKIQEFFTMKCDVCSETFATLDQLQRHTRKQHNMRGSIKCCNRVFYKKCRIIDHINFHLNPGRFRCDICNKNYNDKYYLDLHNQKKHNNEVEKPFKCDKCGKTFVREYLLKAHIATHIQAECAICHKMLANISTLRAHIVNMHSDDSKHICDSCGQEFRTKLAMDRHIKQHLGINPIERIQCHICSKWVNGKPNLKLHIKTVHNAVNQAVACEICQQISPNLRALSSHKRRVHVEERFECEFCGKKFKRKIYLKEHRASHTGETLYSCNVCGMTTNSNANLYSHKKSKHPDEWREAKKKAIAAAYG
ncbi:transcription factor grauzone-like [Sabethes cyaneus]|uniref:transcription factor grauzone-like n=1 Tax=Sabethes cyaneus TaxID=53552 RepID=UPI00237E99AB|nr:transcription factor grauzone-like [Sabethes cyaneus]